MKSFVHCVSLYILCFLVIRCLSCPSPTTFLVRMHLRQEIIRNTNGMPSTSQSTQGSCNDACGRKREKETSFLRALVTKELPTAREDQLQECATGTNQWEFQDPKMEVLYCTVPYLRRGDTKGSCVRRYNSDCRCDVTLAWVVHEPCMKLDIHS